MEANKGIHRQGDVLFVPISAEEMAEAIKSEQAHKVKNGVVQNGETTGHAHRVSDLEAAEVFSVKDWQGERKFLSVSADGGIAITH